MERNNEPLTKGQKTQEKILRQALELFGKHGFANTSMQMIADALDLSQGAVMQHFSSKRKLLEAARRYVSLSNHQYVDTRILPGDEALIAIKKHVLYNLEWALKNRSEASVIVNTYNLAIHDKEFAEAAAGAIRLGTERIYRYILAAQREKSISNKENADILAEAIHEYLVGLFVRTLSAGDSQKLSKSLHQRIDIMVERLLGLSGK